MKIINLAKKKKKKCIYYMDSISKIISVKQKFASNRFKCMLNIKFGG